jgi:hypothetical protein
MSRILVTSASGANGDGYGAILSFTADGELTGPFGQDRRVTDPRGLSPDPPGELVYLNSGDDRVLAHAGGRGLDRGPDGCTVPLTGEFAHERRRAGRMPMGAADGYGVKA